jgi:hypothetical protein
MEENHCPFLQNCNQLILRRLLSAVLGDASGTPFRLSLSRRVGREGFRCPFNSGVSPLDGAVDSCAGSPEISPRLEKESSRLRPEGRTSEVASLAFPLPFAIFASLESIMTSDFAAGDKVAAG